MTKLYLHSFVATGKKIVSEIRRVDTIEATRRRTRVY